MDENTAGVIITVAILATVAFMMWLAFSRLTNNTEGAAS